MNTFFLEDGYLLFLSYLMAFFWLILKVLIIFFMFSMVKAIVPRFRYDQLMRLGWKVFLPMSLAWVVIVATLAQLGVSGYVRW